LRGELEQGVHSDEEIARRMRMLFDVVDRLPSRHWTIAPEVGVAAKQLDGSYATESGDIRAKDDMRRSLDEFIRLVDQVADTEELRALSDGELPRWLMRRLHVRPWRLARLCGIQVVDLWIMRLPFIAVPRSRARLRSLALVVNILQGGSRHGRVSTAKALEWIQRDDDKLGTSPIAYMRAESNLDELLLAARAERARDQAAAVPAGQAAPEAG
jgi:hypothetical protein